MSKTPEAPYNKLIKTQTIKYFKLINTLFTFRTVSQGIE